MMKQGQCFLGSDMLPNENPRLMAIERQGINAQG